MQHSSSSTSKPWMRKVLLLAGIYNILWGASVVLFPGWFFAAFSLPAPVYPEIWQCVGMIVGVYGVGYVAASADPLRHWPIVLVGFLGKIFGPIGFAQQVITGKWPIETGLQILANDLIWWIPFWLILVAGLRAESGEQSTIKAIKTTMLRCLSPNRNP